MTKRPDLHVLEIGSYKGESAKLFLGTGLVEHITCIDAWENGYDPLDIASHATPMAEVEAEFDQLLGPRVTKIKGRSNQVPHLIRDQSIDVVYIDACHQYQAVREDILLYLPKVVLGGILAGHDLPWPGVRKAVKELLGNVTTFPDGSWAISI